MASFSIDFNGPLTTGDNSTLYDEFGYEPDGVGISVGGGQHQWQ